MADISQDIYDKGRRIRKILFQQFKNLADYEVNELQDIWLSFVKDVQGCSGSVGPVGDGLQVDVTGTANTIKIRKGVYLFQDRILFQEEDFTITGLTTPGGSRTDRVFLIVSEDEKNEVDFPDIVNPVDGGVQALRLAYDFTFSVSENHPASPPTVPVGAIAITLANLNRTAVAIIPSGQIEDRRFIYAQTYHTGDVGFAGRTTVNTGLIVNVEAATGKVAGTSFSVIAGSLALPNNATSYIYINSAGSRVQGTTFPLDIAAMEAKVVTAGGSVSSITDLRQFRPQTQVSLDFEDIRTEVEDARGTQPSLDDRLDVSLNEDGTLKPSAAFGGAIDQDEIDILRAHQQTVPAMTVFVEAGQGNYGSEALDWPGGSSPVFTAPVTNPRIDLLYLTDTGTLAVIAGAEAVSPTPPPHNDKLPIAEITLAPAQTTILDANIRDVRPFLNLGGSGGGSSILDRLQLLLSESVYERAILDPLTDGNDIDGVSSGTLVSASNFEIAVGETLVTDFSVAPDGAPASIEQVGVAVLTTQEISPSDLTVEVNRGFGFQTVVTFDGVSGEHTFTGTSGNVLNLRLTNNGASTINVSGYALLFNNSGGTGGGFAESAVAGSFNEIPIRDFSAAPDGTYTAAPVDSLVLATDLVTSTLVPCVNFAPTTDARISSNSFKIPSDFDPDYGLDLVIRYAMTTSFAGNLRLVYFTQAGTPALLNTFTTTGFTETAIATGGHVGEIVTSLYNPSTLDPGDEVIVWFARNGSHVADTHTGTFELISLAAKYRRAAA